MGARICRTYFTRSTPVSPFQTLCEFSIGRAPIRILRTVFQPSLGLALSRHLLERTQPEVVPRTRMSQASGLARLGLVKPRTVSVENLWYQIWRLRFQGVTTYGLYLESRWSMTCDSIRKIILLSVVCLILELGERPCSTPESLSLLRC
jgi:hypothetical protein